MSHDTAFNIVTDSKKVRVYDGVATLSAGGGTRWHEVIRVLDPIGANAHGWPMPANSGAVNVSQCDLDSGGIECNAPDRYDTSKDVAVGLARVMKDRRQCRIDNQVMDHAWQPEIAYELQ